MEATTARIPVVTRREAHALAAAMRALLAIKARSEAYGWATPNLETPDTAYIYGELHTAADLAEEHVFNLLNIASASSFLNAPAARVAIDRRLGKR